MSNIKVLLVEDHTIVRKGIISLLENELRIEIIGEAENGIDAVKMAEEIHPDVMVLDISLPLLNGLEVTKQVTKRFPKIKILILTMHNSEEFVFELLKAGAKGYVIKKAAPHELISAIHAIYHGESYFSPEISKMVLDRLSATMNSTLETDSLKLLTKREREVLQLIAEGRPNREIAEIMLLSIKTIESHRANIMNKLNFHNVSDLIKFAIRKGIINL